ncbi:tyrosine-type recombinase/integrase [Halapricum desulfuricans]|uniref:XerD/XerC family integrase n=1 Tax=Halapricum desulfuricans TaxID=2841257 RepID=A0A897ND53_9EURY|nr:tyrosine-type recombinase/integrase [Halapricum desulfuricans]QSG08889.1 XerD/XerC family integrase [Halapricum desulfuricans]
MTVKQDVPDLEIAEAVDLFIRRKRPDWNGGTERTYRRNLELFVEYTAERELETLDDLSRWDVGAYTDWLLEQDYAKATVASRQKSARTWLKYLASQGLVEHGLHTAIETLRLDDEEETSDQQLAPEDARTLLAFYRESAEYRGTRRHAILEVLWHVGCRMSGLRALDLGDYDAENGDLLFRNRPETDTRLKRGRTHERNVTLSEEPQAVLDLYVARERIDVRDEHGREPLFTSQTGRPTIGTIRSWMYEATQPCMARECPHGKRRPNCAFVPRDQASQCPSTRSPHPIRRGSITWQRNLGFSAETVAERAAATPSVIRRYYDDPDYDDELERRRSETAEIDIRNHLHPTDLEDSA